MQRTGSGREDSVEIMERLSERDKAVVNTIFDPLMPLGHDFLNSGNEKNDTVDHLEKDKLSSEVLNIVKRAISCAELRDFEKSCALFEEALNKCPRSPSILNDRAQALRLAGRNEEALRDLDLAIEYSEGKGRSGVQALCQRGVLYRSMKDDEKARDDFTLAAKGGSNFARSQLVALNPYAAMCNAMLREISLKDDRY